jgi:hypothetical protein
MRRFNTIIESANPPGINQLWVDKKKLRYFTEGKWHLLGDGGSNPPEISDHDTWIINGEDTGKPTRGEEGSKGDNGLTPFIGTNKHWWIGTTDTGVVAEGTDGIDGDNGLTPQLRVTDTAVEYSYDGITWIKLIPKSDFVVNNEITNSPDEEDLTSINDKLKLKNKAYSPAEFSGLGRIYLRKNITGNKNILTQDMINTGNTIYIIQYDYDLNGSSINIPDNCVLKFEGGTLSNGTITFNKTHITDGKFINVIPLGNINNKIAYAKWFESEDDTKVIHWLFTIAADNVQIELENKTYNVDSSNTVYAENGFVKFDNINSYIINGNGAIIYDKVLDTDIGNYIYGFFYFTNCSNININNINYIWKYQAVLESTVKGIVFVRTINECHNFNINAKVTNVGRGIYSGKFNYTNGIAGRGLCDSNISIDAINTGYPIAIERGDNLIINNKFSNVHRGLYLAGVTNSKVLSIGKDAYYTKVNTLLTDTVDSLGTYCCDNIDATVIDNGTTKVNSSISLVIYQLYPPTAQPQFKDRKLYTANIKINASAEGNASCGFELFRYSNIDNLLDNINVELTGVLEKVNNNDRLIRTNNITNGNLIIKNFRRNATITCLISNDLKENTNINFDNCSSLNINIPPQLNDSCGNIIIKNSYINSLRCEGGDNDNYPNITFDNNYVNSILLSKNIKFNPIGLYITNSVNGIPIVNNIIVNTINSGTVYFNTSKFPKSVVYLTINNISNNRLSFTFPPSINGTGSNIIHKVSAGKSIIIIFYNVNGVIHMEKLNISSNTDIGNTSEQPTLGVNDIGFNYFNTALKKPLWWNGTDWITYPDSGGSTMATLTFTGAVKTTYNGATPVTVNIPTGGGGTTNYEDLSNKPKIGDVELVGTKTLVQLGIQPAGDYATETYVTEQIAAVVGNINSVLDTINGEVI